MSVAAGAMRPIALISEGEARALRGLLFDLDDTLLSHGLLSRAAYDAMWDLKDAGLLLVAVTGRPSGWGEVIARQWPIEAAVTENGAVVVFREGRGVGRFERCDEAERTARRARLARIVEGARVRVPEAQLTDDVAARRSDVTWDIGERVRLPGDRIAALAQLVVDAGARTTRSSVHLHATFDADDKATGTLAYLARAFAEDPGAATGARWAFCGDSGNDAACFAAFRTTFAVANVKDHLARIPVGPRYVTRGAMGDGFAEIARTLLERRG
jgi:HAD superfamily hydrolase (TIGR01484 family)